MESKINFRKAKHEFVTKYDEVIKEIATYNKVDMSTGAEMFMSNLDEDIKGNKAPYSGGGVIESDKWKEMVEDYKKLKGLAKEE